MKPLVKIFLVIAFIAISFNVYGTTKTSTGSGNWNTAGTWTPSGVPVAGDDVIIADGHNVTVNTAAVCASLTMNSGGTATTLTISGSNSLTVTGAVTINGGTGNNDNKIIAVGAGTFSCASITMVDPGNDNRDCDVTISTGIVTVSGNITMNGSTARNLVVFSGAGTLYIGGTMTGGALTTATGCTVNYNNNGAQTIGNYTYVNLTLSGDGLKTKNTATVNGILSVEGTATISAAPTYGSAATLQYNTASAQTSGVEWITPFAATGGVIIANTGAITINEAKVFNASVPLTINSGAVLNTNDLSLTLGGNLTISGTFNAGSSAITIGAGIATQTISGFTTTGTVSMTKTGGTATLQGNVNGGALTINGSGGTLNLGSGFTHTFTGTWTRTNGTLNGGSSTLKLGAGFSGTGGAFTASLGTVEWYAAGDQTCAGVTYNNLILSGSGTKTLTSIITIGGNLTTSGTVTATTAANMTIGSALIIGSGTIFSIGNNYTISVSGATSVDGTLTLAGTGAKTFTGNVTINNGGIWNETGVAAINYSGNLQNDGTFTVNTGIHTFNGTSKTINGANEIAIPNLTISGTTTNNGTLTVTTAIAGSSTLTNGATGILNYGGTGAINPTLTATAAGNLVNYNGANQTAKVTTYVNLTISGSGTKTFATTPTINGILSLEGTAIVNVTSGVVTYGSNATLRYNTTTSRTASSETWVTPFTATGGVIIDNTGVITMNTAKVFNSSIPLTINNGASLTTGNYQLTFGGNFTNNGGTFTAGSSPFDITGAVAQSIDGFSTTGAITVSKTSGIATLNNTTGAASLTFTTSGATLSLSDALTLTGALILNNAAAANVTAAITGAGSLSCGSVDVGNGTAATGNTTTYTHTLTSTVSNFTVSGNLNINSYFVATNRIRNGVFSLASGTVTVNGSVTTVNANAANTSLINMTTGAQTGTLVLGGATPFTISGIGTSTTTLNGTGATVNYNYAGPQIVRNVIYTNLTLAGSGAKTTTGATVNGTLSMQGTATTTGTVATYGAASALEYAGSAAQTTGTEFPATWSGTGGVIINNASGVALNGAKTVRNLTLTNGLLTLGADNLTIDPAGSINGGSAGNYVLTNGAGQLKRTVNNNITYVLFPVGLSVYNPLNMKLDAASTTDIFGVKISDAITNAGYNPAKTVNRQWDITKATGNTSNATIQFQFNADEGLTDYTTGQIGHWNGTSYDEIASSISGSGPYIITNMQLITSFSPFIVGNAYPMPVELSSFTANVISRDVKLNWVTATELNNAGFEIQKSEVRGQKAGDWTKVGYITGNGTKTTPTNYTFEDKNLNTGKYNYRLKQTDYNGNFEYHNLNGIVEIGVPDKFALSQNYPNPFNPTTKIDFNLPYDSKVSMKLYDISGREVMTLVNEQKTAGYYTVQMNGNNLSSGMYFYRIIAEGNGQNFVSTKKLTLIK